MVYTKRFQKCSSGFIFNYSIKWKSFKDKVDKNYWESETVKFAGIRRSEIFKWFNRNSSSQNEHVICWFTLFGIEVFWGQSWRTERII